MIWFTSDTHFGHGSVLRFENNRRDFDSIWQHDEHLVNCWNEVIQDNDDVYHLGDFAYKCSRTHAEGIWWQLKGKKHLVIGNHEQMALKFRENWESIQHLLKLEITLPSGYTWPLLLSHRPFLSFEKGVWHLHGHTHGSIPDMVDIPEDTYHGKRMDVGVDTNNYYPYSLDQIINKLWQQKQ